MGELSYFFEEKAREKGFLHIAGVDEAGRGPLAGPVVAAACILPLGYEIVGVNDSKKLSRIKRAALYRKMLLDEEILFGIGIVDAATIDDINILQATFLAMQKAIKDLKKKPDYALIDGNQLPFLSIPGETIVKGDALCFSIAAASIIAKETRDQIMEEYDIKWPHYGFGAHRGYGTKKHLQAIDLHGPCAIHRKSFAPIAKKGGGV